MFTIADIDYREYFTPEKIAVIEATFKKYDQSGKGELSEAELLALFKKLGKSMTRQQLREVLKEVDYNSSGTIDFEELCILEIKMSRCRPRADLINYHDYLDRKTIWDLKHHFVQQDPNGRGFIGLAELEKILELMGCKVAQEEVDEVLAEVDKENTGELEFDKLACLWAVLNKCRKRLNYREFLDNEEVAHFRAMFREVAGFEGDARGTNLLTRTELHTVFKNMGVQLRKSQLNVLFRDFDLDRSEDIDFAEFCLMMMRIRSSKRKRVISPATHSCETLWRDEDFTVHELQLSGFGLQDFRKAGIPVSKIYKDGHVPPLELRQAGYSAAELRRGGVGATALRACGFSLTELRNAGFSDAVLLQTNRMLHGCFALGDLSILPQQRPGNASAGGPQNSGPKSDQSAACTAPPRQLTPRIRDHVDWQPVLCRSEATKPSVQASLLVA